MAGKRRRKIGLALGSGGIRGLAHIGVLKALVRSGINIDFIAGSSIGAWMGAHYALFRDLERLETYSVGKKKEKLYAMVELTIQGGLIKGQKIESLIKSWLGDPDFSDAKIPLRIVATDLISGSAVEFSTGRIVPAVRASISVPSIFVPYRSGDNCLVDGGLCNPVPADIVRSMGADIVVAVNLDNFTKVPKISMKDTASLAKVTNRSIELLRHHLARHCLAPADIVIEPANTSEELYRWKNYFLHDVGERHIALGEAAAEECLPGLKALLKST